MLLLQDTTAPGRRPCPTSTRNMPVSLWAVILGEEKGDHAWFMLCVVVGRTLFPSQGMPSQQTWGLSGRFGRH